jgi:HD-GYP domain-containing protein (c-di-GMP phosphodiesterase class II)
MIDWFPPPSTDNPARSLARWHGIVSLRRAARAIDALEPSTEGHSERVADLAARIARDVGWSRRRGEELREAGRVHDIGKACIPQVILQTPGQLSPQEYEIVKSHAALGADVAEAVLSARQANWIRHHHERWDGRGYPDGLVGEEIPEGGLILSIADAWDAMTHRSWAGSALTPAVAIDECRRESGRQFAGWAVAALERVLEERRPRFGQRRRLVTAA